MSGIDVRECIGTAGSLSREPLVGRYPLGAARRDATAQAEGRATARAEEVRDAAGRIVAAGDREQLRAIARPPWRREERRCGDLRRGAVEAADPDRRRLAQAAAAGP